MDFIPQFEPLFGEAEAKAVYDYIKSGGWITEFKRTQEFELAVSKFTGAKHAVATNNGTISLSLALLATGIKSGDEVLVPDITMIATPNSVKMIGAVPIFADIDPGTLCMDLHDAKKRITANTKALIYVSLNGRCGDMKEVQDFCKNNGLFLLEDSAQSLGSYFKKTHIGRFGAAGSFSFSTPKIISTGQGGMIITDDDDMALKLRRLKDFGRREGGNDIHDSIGYNFKFTDIQAVVGLEQFKTLSERMISKKKIYSRYYDNLYKLPQIKMLPTNLDQTTPWFVDIYVDDPDQLKEQLFDQGIGTRRIYPAIHTQKAYSRPGDYPQSTLVAQTGLWLPSSVQLKDGQIDRICSCIKKYYQ